MDGKPQTKDYEFMEVAMNEARQSLAEGGIPIGSCLVIDDTVVASGHNQRVQQGNPILHGEMDCLQKAGRLTPDDYRKATLYTTLSPCSMCTGAIRLFKIPRVVMAENVNFLGDEQNLMRDNIELVNLHLKSAMIMMADFIKTYAELWHEDISKI